MKAIYEQVIDDIRNGRQATIHPELYRAYSENLTGGVSGVFGGRSNSSKNLDTQLQLEANVARFAAYKAYHATQQLNRQLTDANGNPRSADDFDRMARTVLNTFNRYQAAEYNTAVARARSAKQWEDFSHADNMLLFPNIRWLPSRSATQREEHQPFYNRVWAKNDPFWNTNQPGNLWNCKCDWEETDDPVTGDNPEGLKPAKGLEGNPAKTGEVFTDECTYVKKAGKNRKQRDLVEKQCQEVSRKLFKEQASTHPLLHQKTVCLIENVEHEVIFRDYGIKEFAEKMYGSKQYWLKNQIVDKLPSYIKNASWFKTDVVDVSHNTGRTLRLKKKLQWFHYFSTSLPDGTPCVLEIVEYKTGEFCFYTMVRNKQSTQ